MRKTLLVLLFVFMWGCYSPYQEQSNSTIEKFHNISERARQGKLDSDRLNRNEAAFISSLNNEELAAYSTASDLYNSGNQADKELARRGLQAVMSDEKYMTAMGYLKAKLELRQDFYRLKNEYRQAEAEGDILIQSMR